MILDISNELMDTGRSKQYTVSYESDTFSYRDGDFRVVSSEPFELRIVSPAKNKIHITGSGSIILAIPCSRCLEDVNTVIRLILTKKFRLTLMIMMKNSILSNHIMLILTRCCIQRFYLACRLRYFVRKTVREYVQYAVIISMMVNADATGSYPIQECQQLMIFLNNLVKIVD